MTGLKADFTRRLRPFTLEVSLCAGDGILALFGASGAGKTQTLECLAGLARPDAGAIALNGETLFCAPTVNLPARVRRIGYVVQDGALFPHLTAGENVAYGMRGQADAAARAAALLDEMGLPGLGNRYPRELSGGQQRRVAIARALAIQPRLLLLDEPFVHLDRLVRARLMRELPLWLKQRNIPAILVTHDLEEVAACADRIAVIEQGRIVQQGTRVEVLFRPASRGVATLLGEVNVLAATVAGEAHGLWRVNAGGLTWHIPFVGDLRAGEEIEIVVRASAVKIIRPDAPVPGELALNQHPGKLLAVDMRPDLAVFTVALAGGLELTGRIPADVFTRANIKAGEERMFAVPPEGLQLFRAR